MVFLYLLPRMLRRVYLWRFSLDKLASALRRHNRSHREGENIRMRMALHAGEVYEDAHGVTGSSLNFTLRMLDAQSLASALRNSSGTLALITSSWLYDEVVRHSVSMLTRYSRVSFSVKETSAEAWVCTEVE